jgi:hypothetical protein
MKLHIGKYNSWFGPYQLAELLFFWVKKEKNEYGFREKPEWIHKFGEWLAYGNILHEPEVGEVSKWNKDRKKTLLYKFLSWIDNKKKRRVKIHIDEWDTWSMDSTLALIVLPMLRQLKQSKQGAPLVDLEDVPEQLRYTTHQSYEEQQSFEWYSDDELNEKISYEYLSKRWDWVLDEMIYAFSYKVGELDEIENSFHKGEIDFVWIKQESGNYQMVRGEKDTHVYDVEGHKIFMNRINNGFRLFGKYYQNLWD